VATGLTAGGLPAGVLAVSADGLHRPGWPDPAGLGGALVSSAGRRLSSGEPAVFAVPVTVAPAVVRADGRVQAGGHLADHVRLGLLEAHLPAGVIEDLVGRLSLGRQRLRRLSAPMAARCVLAMTLMPQACYREVMATVAGQLAVLPWATRWEVPGGEVLGRWRVHLGVALFERLYWRVAAQTSAEHAGLGGAQDIPGVRLGGLLLCAVDGFQARMPNTPANREAFGSSGTADDSAPYPQLRAVAVTVCATRAQLGAAFDASQIGEQTLTARIADQHPGVFAAGRLYLTDRNFLGGPLILKILQRGGHLLMRVKADIRLPRIGAWLPDGSYRSYVKVKADRAESWIPVRVVEYDAEIDGGVPGELFSLVTDLLDYQRYPAPALCGAYPMRWSGSETHIKEAKSTITGAGPSRGPILRSTTPDMVRQETWGWLAATELVRADARAAAPDTAASPPPAGRQPVTARQTSFTASRRETLRSLTQTAVTATTSPAQLAAAADRAHSSILTQLVQTDRNRHRERVTKVRLDFPPAKGSVPTTTAPARIILHAPAATAPDPNARPG
jgi:hypothetical protein